MNGETANTNSDHDEVLMKLRFQNYTPRTDDLKKYCGESVDAATLLREITESQEQLIKTTNRKFTDPALDLDNLVPRKGNWDMKRHLSQKLDILEQRTRKAILKMARRRMLEDGNLENAQRVLDESSDVE